MGKVCPQHPPWLGITASLSRVWVFGVGRLWCERLRVTPHRAGPPFPECSLVQEASSFEEGC